MKKIIMALPFMLAALLIIIPAVCSIGVTPGRVTINFMPGSEKEITIKVLNTNNIGLNAKITAEGELKDYIHINQGIIEFSQGEGVKELKYKIRLPAELPPGVRKADIIISELPSASNFLNTATAVISQLYVEAPYPDKYLVIEDADAKEEDYVKFRVGVSNKGKEGIEQLYADIQVKNSNKTIFKSNTRTTSLPSMKREVLEALWEDKEVGNYTMLVTANYDGKKEAFSKEFSVLTAKAASEGNGYSGKKTDYFLFAVISLFLIILVLCIFFALRKFNISRKSS